MVASFLMCLICTPALMPLLLLRMFVHLCQSCMCSLLPNKWGSVKQREERKREKGKVNFIHPIHWPPKGYIS